MSGLTVRQPTGSARQRVPGRDEVHVWCSDLIIDPSRFAAALEQLSPDERKRASGFRERRRREQFVSGRAHCRQTLSRYAPVAPREWRFALGHRGKPTVVAPVLPVPLWFSLSHGDGVSVCVVTTVGPDIGVDIERLDRVREGAMVADHFFPAAEAEALRRLPEAKRGEAFAQHWVLKESLAKAAECSLAEALGGSEFVVSQSGCVEVRFEVPTFGCGEDWQFGLFEVGSDRIGAVALRA